jgi:glutathione S-transferase
VQRATLYEIRQRRQVIGNWAICNTMTEEESKDEIILWAIEISGNSSAIRSFLRVTGIPYKEVNAWGKTRTEEYISKFPTNLAPAIEHGSICLSENAGTFKQNHVFLSFLPRLPAASDLMINNPYFFCKFITIAMMRYLCRAFPQKAGIYYPSDKWNEIDMLLDYMGSGILDLLPKAVYPTLGFPAYPGDVAAMESTKSFTEEAAKAAGAAMLKQLEVGAVMCFLCCS